MRSAWTDLPDNVIAAIAERVGEPLEVTPASNGDHADIAATVTGPTAKVFIKAATADLRVRSLRYELAASTAIDRYPPAVLWHFESDDWLVVATEHLAGPHPDLSPASPDLDLLAATLEELQNTRAPNGTWYDPAGRLGFADPRMAGEGLVHSDLNPTNLIVTGSGLRIVDWAFATKAAPWVELALLIQWLIGCGHTAGQAERWVAQFPAWAATDRDVVDDFAIRNAAKWAGKAEKSTQVWVNNLATWTSEWAAYRRSRTPARSTAAQRPVPAQTHTPRP